MCVCVCMYVYIKHAKSLNLLHAFSLSSFQNFLSFHLWLSDFECEPKNEAV